MKKAITIIATAIILLTGCVSNNPVKITEPSYTFDGDVDPVIFLDYTLVQSMPVNKGMVCLFLVGKNPKYVITLMFAQQDTALILCYAHFDNFKLRNFELIDGHYTEKIPSDQIGKALEEMLYWLHDINEMPIDL